MKTLNFLRTGFMLILSLLFHFSNAAGSIMGRVTDPQTKKPVGDVTVSVECQGFSKPFFTNDSGYYYASNIPAGVYTVGASFQGKTSVVTGVKLGNDDVKQVDLEIAAAIELKGAEVKTKRLIYQTPLIDPLNPTSVTLTPKVLKDQGIQKVSDAGELLGGGAVKINGDYYVRGARAGSLSYYIDGCKIMGTPDIPLCGLAVYTSYNGFIPPKYGDTTGGVVVIETRSYFTEY